VFSEVLVELKVGVMVSVALAWGVAVLLGVMVGDHCQGSRGCW